MNKKIIITCLSIVLIIVCTFSLTKVEKKTNKNNLIFNKEIKSLYSWKSNDFKEKRFHLLEVIQERGITDLYHEFKEEFQNEDYTFLKELSQNSIDIYHLTGDPSFAFEEDGQSIKREINKIIEFNTNSSIDIKGIVLDVEPYVNEVDDENFTYEMLKSYQKNMQIGYEYAKKNNLKYVICIPTWYEKISSTLLKKIIQNSDRIEVMNYVVKDTFINIKTEIEYAKELNKEITSIYEVDFSYNPEEDKDKNGIFYSYQEMQDDFHKIKKEYKYDKLYIGYHYFSKM